MQRVRRHLADSPPSSTRALSVHAFDEDAAFARRFARQLEAPCSIIRRHRFSDGETMVRVHPGSSSHAILVVTSFRNPDSTLFESMLAADAMRRMKVFQDAIVATAHRNWLTEVILSTCAASLRTARYINGGP